eukprot:COSAG03_NODE_17850_length_366_cov_7.558052_2_plen_79_part_01
MFGFIANRLRAQQNPHRATAPSPAPPASKPHTCVSLAAALWLRVWLCAQQSNTETRETQFRSEMSSLAGFQLMSDARMP